MWRPKAVTFTPEEQAVDEVPQRVERSAYGVLPHSRPDAFPSIHSQPTHAAPCNNKCTSVLTASYGSLGRLEVSCPRTSYIQLPPPPMPSLRSMVCRNRAQQPISVTDAPGKPSANVLAPHPPGEEVETSLKRDASCTSLGHAKVCHSDLAIRKCETAMGLSSLAVDDPPQKPNPTPACSTKITLGCLSQNARSIASNRHAPRKEKECKRPFVSSRNLITREISASTRNLLLPLRREFSASCTSTTSSSFSPSATSPLLLLQTSGAHGSGILEHSGEAEGPMKPINRLRVSCSRCSSLVSLSASRLSLGVTSVLPTVQAASQEEDESEEDRGSISRVENNDIPEDKIESCNNIGLTMNMDRSESVTSLEVPSSLSLCKLCLTENIPGSLVVRIQHCGCLFCQDCMSSYVAFEIQEGAYDISCPDAQCPAQGALSIPEIERLVGTDLIQKHHRFRLNKEVDMDVNRTWCPIPGCETICTIHPPPLPPPIDTPTSLATTSCQSPTATPLPLPPPLPPTTTSSFCMCPPQKVVCPTCNHDFCSACRRPSHVGMSCDMASQLWRGGVGHWGGGGQGNGVTQLLLPPGVPPDSELIKCCPMCSVPIEKDEGCAQMMCKRCKHVFCWYCLASLDDDFLLRHYDKGPCKNKLGHSRASVIWHRAQVIGIFAGFGILLLVASPLLLLAAPCILCCKCRVCSGGGAGGNGEKLEEEDEEEGGGESIGIVAGKVAARSIKANATVSDVSEMPRETS